MYIYILYVCTQINTFYVYDVFPAQQFLKGHISLLVIKEWTKHCILRECVELGRTYLPNGLNKKDQRISPCRNTNSCDANLSIFGGTFSMICMAFVVVNCVKEFFGPTSLFGSKTFVVSAGIPLRNGRESDAGCESLPHRTTESRQHWCPGPSTSCPDLTFGFVEAWLEILQDFVTIEFWFFWISPHDMRRDCFHLSPAMDHHTLISHDICRR